MRVLRMIPFLDKYVINNYINIKYLTGNVYDTYVTAGAYASDLLGNGVLSL